MSSRVEFERSVTLAGEPVQLYVSCGSQDDYLELVLPEQPALDAPARQRLARLQEGASDDLLDLRFSEDQPTTVSVLALYVGPEAAEWRSRPHPERLAAILARLARAEPAFDFGDLLPAHLAVAEQAPAVVAEPIEAVPAVEPATLPVPRAEAVPAASQLNLPPPAPIVDYLSRAGELAARGRVHKALRAVEDALRQNAADLEAWALREELLLLERRERRRQREPKSAQAQLEVGFSYLTLGCDADAIAALREATRLEPGLYIAYVVLGVAHHHQKQVEEARRCYERAARLRPKERTPRELLQTLRRGLPPPRPVEDRPQALAGMSRFGVAQQWASAG